MRNLIGYGCAHFLNSPAAGLLAGLSFGAGLASAQPEPNHHSTRLKTASFDPLYGVPSLVSPPNDAVHRAGSRGGYRVPSNGPIMYADRRVLEAAGVRSFSHECQSAGAP